MKSGNALLPHMLDVLSPLWSYSNVYTCTCLKTILGMMPQTVASVVRVGLLCLLKRCSLCLQANWHWSGIHYSCSYKLCSCTQCKWCGSGFQQVHPYGQHLMYQMLQVVCLQSQVSQTSSFLHKMIANSKAIMHPGCERAYQFEHWRTATSSACT